MRMFICLLLLTLLLPGRADAYIGPGAGMSAIGAFLALLAGILVTIFGFVWYPIKRLRKKLRRKKEAETSQDT